MGKDVTEAMKDGEEHVHSKSAYEMMDEVSFLLRAPEWSTRSIARVWTNDALAPLQFLVGRLVNGEKTVSDG